MIIKWLIDHQIKEATRSSFWQKQVVLNIVMGLLLLIMLAYLVMLGLFIDKFLETAFPDKDPIELMNGIVLYYLGIEFLVRFFMQSLPVLNLEAYLTLPLKKTLIAHYVSAKSIFNIGNFLSWLVFIPFALKMIAPAQSPGAAWVWILGMIFLVMANNFLANYVKRQLAHKPWVVGAFALGMVALMAIDHFDILSVSSVSRALMGGLTTKPVLLAIPLTAMVVAYLINYTFLRSRLYPDEVNLARKGKAGVTGEWRYLKSIGMTGHLISLDIRLLLRHKRTKSLIWLAPVFLLYGLFFYTEKDFDLNSSFPIFIGIFMTGGIMINYLNYGFSYESNHFDGILARYSDFRQYIRAKYIFAVSVCTISFVLTIPYVFFSQYVLLINLSAFLYNAGFLSFVILYISTYSTKRMDLSRSASFNYQGMGATHWLSMLPGFLLPVLILWPFNVLKVPALGYVLIAVMGLTGLVLHKPLVGIVTRRFLANRYTMAKGFRE